MLQWFRVRASAIATAAIVAMAVVGGSAVVPHEDDCHDAACGFRGDHSAADRIGARASVDDGHALHCLVCHWVRAFRPNAEARIVSTPATNAATRIIVEILTFSGRAPVAQPPLRSPPPSPLAA